MLQAGVSRSKNAEDKKNAGAEYTFAISALLLFYIFIYKSSPSTSIRKFIMLFYYRISLQRGIAPHTPLTMVYVWIIL